MPTPLRMPIVAGCYHAFWRGWECKQQRVFADDRGRTHIVQLLAEPTGTYRIVLHGCVLMDDHHHLVLRASEANSIRAMQCPNTHCSAGSGRRLKLRLSMSAHI